ncbi:FAD-binding domain containing protein [Naviculisporaceae sp. PSN 640]
MQLQFLLVQSLLWAVTVASSSGQSYSVTASRAATAKACTKLAQKYPSLTLLPNTTEYDAQVAHVWSQTCVLYPYCVFEPETAKHVSGALAILKETKTQFAIRSGGHLAKPGSNGITNGVLIATVRLQTLELINNNKVARLGAGLRWGTVYNYTSQRGLAIAGGRFGDVGVPGLLLGGGINWFGSEKGWSFNSVVNFEVVLADGSIVNANASGRYSDLFWALKGGHNNFGIVTRFDCTTFPVTNMYGGLVMYTYTPENYDAYLHAVANYIDPRGGSSDVRSAIDPITVVNPSTGEYIVANFFAHRSADPAPACFSNFTNVNATVSTLRVSPDLNTFQIEANDPQFADRSQRQLAWVTGLKAQAESVYLANRTFTEMAFSRLGNLPNLTTSITYQPVTKSWLQAAKAAGGDALDLDPANGGFIVLQIATVWQNAQHDSIVAKFSTDVVAAIDARAKAAGLHYPFNYINDAGFSQKIYSLYGGDRSLPKLKKIAKKYDPNEVFQKLQPGGFKLSAEW